MKDKEWEDLCDRCSLCCYSRLALYDTLTVFINHPCEYLDEKEKRCTIYSERLKKNKNCLKVNRLRAMASRSLPDSCAYVLWAKKRHIRLCRNRALELRNLDE